MREPGTAARRPVDTDLALFRFARTFLMLCA